MGVWTYCLLDDLGRWRWLIERNGRPEAMSCADYDTREEAVNAMARFSTYAEHLTYSVVPVDILRWTWIATDHVGVVACSGPCIGIGHAQAASEAVRLNASNAEPVSAGHG